MIKFKVAIPALVIIIVLITLSFSCNSTSELLSNNSAMANTSNDNEDVSSRIHDLENRVAELEQVLGSVIEYNIVKSALIQMLQENDYIDTDWGSIAGCGNSSSWAPTNDMRLFPSPTHPLYGYDKDGDGIPDTNYVPFETSKWYYDFNNDLEIEQFPDMGWAQLPKRPTLEELQQAGKNEAFETELHNIQTAVLAAMADGGVDAVAGGCVYGSGVENFGNTGHATSPPYTGTDCVVSGSYSVGDYITNGATDIACSYSIASDGTVTQVWTP